MGKKNKRFVKLNNGSFCNFWKALASMDEGIVEEMLKDPHWYPTDQHLFDEYSKLHKAKFGETFEVK